MKHINIVGPVNKLGFGTHCTSMVKAFDEIGMDVSLQHVGEIQDDFYHDLFKDSMERPFNEDSPTLHIFHDEFLEKFPGSQTIAFTIFETDVIRPLALQKIQQHAKMVFTTTKEHKKILEANGVRKPIHVVNEGVDPELYNTKPCEKLIETGKFTYFMVGKNEKRKNTNKIMNAFIQEMQYEDVALICHSYNYHHQANEHFKNWYNTNLLTLGYKYEEENNYYIKFTNGFSDIYLTKPVLERDEMKRLYTSANVGIAYSSAEGWGLPETELMACGVPLIISNVIGHKEYLANMPVFQELIIDPVGTEVANDGIHFHGDRGSWSKMEITPLKDKMRYVYENKIGNEASEELSNYMHCNYNWKLQAEKVKQLILRG